MPMQIGILVLVFAAKDADCTGKGVDAACAGMTR
jgi:hypothetical protein